MKIKVSISTNKVGSECQDIFEIDDAEWNKMSEDEKNELAQEYAFNYLEWYWEEVE